MTLSASSLSERALSESSGSTGPAAAVTLGGASSGYVSAAANFTAGADGDITGTITVTPSDSGGGGTFSPASVNITNGSPTGGFTYTPGSLGVKAISVTNSGGLSNPGALSFTSVTNLPGKPTGVAAASGDTTATVGFLPGDTGGAAVTYTVTATPGDASSSGSASPVIVYGLTNGIAYTFIVSPANVNGTGTLSDPSNAVTPDSMVTACKLAPFVDSDVLTSVVAQVYANVAGTMTAVGATATVNTVALVTNGRQVLAAAPPNNADGSFRGVLRWATGSGEFFVDELNIAARSFGRALGDRTITKVCNLPFGTNVSGTVGYQLFDSAGAAVGGLVTTGILVVPGVTNTDKLCVDLTRPTGWSGYIRWTNGAGVYSMDEVAVFGAVVLATTRTVTLTLTSDGTAVVPGLTGLRWAWFDQAQPDAWAAPTDQGAVESTDGSGVLAISVRSALAPGATGWLVVTNSDGTAAQSPSARAFSGPVVVT